MEFHSLIFKSSSTVLNSLSLFLSALSLLPYLFLYFLNLVIVSRDSVIVSRASCLLLFSSSCFYINFSSVKSLVSSGLKISPVCCKIFMERDVFKSAIEAQTYGIVGRFTSERTFKYFLFLI